MDTGCRKGPECGRLVKKPRLLAFWGGCVAASPPGPSEPCGKRCSLKVRKEESGELVSAATCSPAAAMAGPCRPVLAPCGSGVCFPGSPPSRDCPQRPNTAAPLLFLSPLGLSPEASATPGHTGSH